MWKGIIGGAAVHELASHLYKRSNEEAHTVPLGEISAPHLLKIRKWPYDWRTKLVCCAHSLKHTLLGARRPHMSATEVSRVHNVVWLTWAIDNGEDLTC